MSDGIDQSKLDPLHDAVQRWAMTHRARVAARRVVEDFDRQLIVIPQPWPIAIVDERKEAVAKLMWWGEEERRRLVIMQEAALAATEVTRGGG